MRRRVFLIACLGLLLILAACLYLIFANQDTRDAVVAGQEVNSQQVKSINADDLRQLPPTACRQPCVVSRKNQLRLAIYRQWLLLEARNIGINNQTIDQRYQVDLATWQSNRIGQRPTRNSVKYLLITNALAAKVPLKDEAIKRQEDVTRLNSDRQSYQPLISQPDNVSRNLLAIRLKREEDSIKAAAALAEGQDFANIARRFAPSARAAGKYRFNNVPSNFFGPEIEKLLRASPPGTTIGPVRDESGFWWIIRFVSLGRMRGGALDRGSVNRQERISAGINQLPVYLASKWRRLTYCRSELMNSFCSRSLD